MRRKSLLAFLLLATISFTHVGCAALIALPLYVLALPFQVIKIVISLLPTLIKYAPLALLFVESEDAQSLNGLQQVVEQYNREGATCVLQTSVLSDSITVCTIQFMDAAESPEILLRSIETILEEQKEARILFAKNDILQLDNSTELHLWQKMQEGNIKVGYDSRIELFEEKVDTSTIG